MLTRLDERTASEARSLELRGTSQRAHPHEAPEPIDAAGAPRQNTGHAFESLKT